MRLYIVVEGYTEEVFVTDVLVSHLRGFGISQVTPIIVPTSRDPRTGAKMKGGGHFEALLETPEDIAGLARLRSEIQDWQPEDINDGDQSAPSKRLEKHIPGYLKTVHGPLVTYDTGLATLRSACPRFSLWLTKLETLGQEHAP